MSTSSPIPSDVKSVALNSTPYSVAWVTVPSREVGVELSKELLEKKLVACVNIIPGISSLYWWDGKVCEDSELLLMMKTQTSLMDEVIKFVTTSGKHPYTTPEVISMEINQGSRPYLDWIRDSTTVTAPTSNLDP